MSEENYKYSELTDKIIEAFYKVYNALGYGFLGKVYENSMVIELRRAGLEVAVQQPVKVYYEGEEVGFYFADLVVEKSVIVEFKAVESIAAEHEAQLINYLRASEIEVGLLMNFGKKAQLKRKVSSNNYKTNLAEIEKD